MMTAVKELVHLGETDKVKTPEKETATATDTVVKVIEVIGTSKLGFDDAITTAIKAASHTLRHVTGADVKHMTIGLSAGKITEYRVNLKLAFALEPEGDEDDD
jgi:hypothetical protein